MELACPPCPRLLRASASFCGLGAAQRGHNRLRHVVAHRSRAIFARASMRMQCVGQRRADCELPAEACSRRLPALLAQADQKKGRLRVRRRQNLAALGYGRAHAHSILSMALREFCNEIRLYGDWRWEP